jgi:hypothetical protein
MAVIAVENGEAGIAGLTFTAATGGGDTVTGGHSQGGWSADVVIVVAKNAHTAAQTVTVAGHPPIAVAPSGGIGIIPVHGGIGAKAVTYSGVTALTVGAFNL